MATLTETSFIIRKSINIGVILLVVGFILRFVILGAFGIYDTLFPKPPPAATMAFGLLPMPAAQNSIATPSSRILYSLETSDGNLPQAPHTFKVYFIPHATSAFGTYDRMKATAASLSFSDTPQRTGATSWRFVDRASPLRVMDIDEISQNFRIKYNYLSDQSLFNDKNFSTNDQIASEARAFFDRVGVLPIEFKGGSSIITYYKFDSGALVTTTAIANADAIGVTLTRTNIDSGDKVIDKIPVVSPDYRQGLVSVLFSGSGDAKKRVLEARFLASSVDLQNSATYQPLNSQDAWAKLQAGQAIFASLPTPMSNSIVIRKAYFAYLDPYPLQSFLQPVMVFSDEKGFVAYVPLTAK